MTEEVGSILLKLVCDLVDCENFSDFEEVRGDCFRALLMAGFYDKFYEREEVLFALVDTGLIQNRGLRLEGIQE